MFAEIVVIPVFALDTAVTEIEPEGNRVINRQYQPTLAERNGLSAALTLCSWWLSNICTYQLNWLTACHPCCCRWNYGASR